MDNEITIGKVPSNVLGLYYDTAKARVQYSCVRNHCLAALVSLWLFESPN